MGEENYKYQVLVNGVGRVIDVSNPDSSGAQGWSYDTTTKTITIFTPSDYTLTGTTSENKVIIEPTNATKSPFNVILQGVNINKSSEANSSAISIRGNAFCRLLLYGSNYFNSGSNAAAVNVSYGSSIEIDELIPDRGGHISAQGGENASSIGANISESYGDITIKNVRLNIRTAQTGSGIGFASSSSQNYSGEIKIIGGDTSIYGYSQNSLAGIYCRKLEISSGKVTVRGDSCPGISLKGNNNVDNKIIIDGDAEVIAYGGKNYPGIQCSNGSVIVNGGVVKAYGGDNSCGIGASYNARFEVIINKGVVCAYGGTRGAGIGTGERFNWYDYTNNSLIKINGGIVSAYGKDGAAGIGGGVGVKMPNIKISSEASVIAQAYGEGAYDIGDGISSMNNRRDYFSGVFSSVCMYRGQISGTYQGKLSGLFKGEIQRDYTKRVACNLSGFYTGRATGRYSGLFLGRYVGYLEYSSLYTGLYSGLYSGLYTDTYSEEDI